MMDRHQLNPSEGVAQDGEGSGGTPDATPTTTGGNGTKSRTKHPPGGEVSRQYPRCLRRVCGAGGFLVVHCLQQVVDGAATTYITTCTTHLRRHLQFSHPHLAAILLLRHLGPVLMGVILSQVGGRGHRARWVAAAQLLTALATLATLTTALIPPPTPPLDSREEDGQDGELYCDVKLLAALANEPTVSEASWVTSWRNGSNTSLASYSRPSPSLTHQHSCIHSHTLTVLVWVFASVLSGVGSCLIFTLGIPYLDDAVSKQESPLYLAVITSMGVFGPLLGLSLSDLTLTLYVYPAQHHGISVEDPRWIGAWWLGQLVLALLMLTLASLLLFYPRSLSKEEVCERAPQCVAPTHHSLDEHHMLEEMVRTSVVPCDTPARKVYHTPPAPPLPLPPPAPPDDAVVTDDDCSVEERETVRDYVMDERDSGYSMELETVDVVEEKGSQYAMDADHSHSHHNTLEEDLQKNDITTHQEIQNGIKEVWKTLGRVLKNKVVVYTMCSDFFLVLATSTVMVWLPKYMQQHFRVTKTNSSFFTGICGTSSAIVGVGVGGVWVRRCHPRARTLALVMAACTALHAASIFSLMFISCGFDADLPGIMSPDFRSVELHRGCSEGCKCVTAEMSPVCVRDGPITLSYYSPCHAGCPHPTNQDNLTNCTCGSAAAQITRGYCRDKCSIFVLYNVVNCITKSLLSVTIIGSLLITLRCVGKQDKPAALGLKSTVMSLAALVTPLVSGSIIDSACLVWKEACDVQTSCSLYNTIDFGHKFHGLTSVVFALSTIFTLLVSKHVRDLELLEDAPYNLPTFSFFDAGVSSSPSIRRSFRKMSRLASGRRSSGKWKVPTMTSSQTWGGELQVIRQQDVRNDDDGSDVDTQPTVSVLKPNILPSLIMKTTNV